MANPGTRIDAFPAFHFEVDIGGVSYPFRSASGLKSETKVYEVEEGGVNTHIHKLVGPTSFPNLVLRQGFCNPSSPLYKMYLDFVSEKTKGSGKRRIDGFVRQIGPNGTSAKWVFQKGWIAKWEGPELDATKNEISIESIEIVHEGIYLVGGSSATASAGVSGSGSTSGTSSNAGSTSSSTSSSTGTSSSSGTGGLSVNVLGQKK